MKSIFLSSLLSCMVIGQVFGAENQLVARPDPAQRETRFTDILKTAACVNLPWMACAVASGLYIKVHVMKGVKPKEVAAHGGPMLLAGLGLSSLWALGLSSAEAAYSRVQADNNLSDDRIIAQRREQKIESKRASLNQLLAENRIALAQVPEITLSAEDEADIIASINSDRELAARRPSTVEWAAALVSAACGVVGTFAAVCWGLSAQVN